MLHDEFSWHSSEMNNSEGETDELGNGRNNMNGKP